MFATQRSTCVAAPGAACIPPTNQLSHPPTPGPAFAHRRARRGRPRCRPTSRPARCPTRATPPATCRPLRACAAACWTCPRAAARPACCRACTRSSRSTWWAGQLAWLAWLAGWPAGHWGNALPRHGPCSALVPTDARPDRCGQAQCRPMRASLALTPSPPPGVQVQPRLPALRRLCRRSSRRNRRRRQQHGVAPPAPMLITALLTSLPSRPQDHRSAALNCLNLSRAL